MSTTTTHQTDTQQDDDAKRGQCSLQIIPTSKPSAPAHEPRPRPFNKDKTLKKYQAQLHTVKCLACVSAALFSLNWFLGLCALTWASTVILGGLLPQLGHNDFYCISALLLLEAFRLATATFFGNFVTRKLIYRSTLPALIKYDDEDRHRIYSQIRQGFGPDLSAHCARIQCLPPIEAPPKSPNPPPQQLPDTQHFDGLHHSLQIFYILVLLNAFFAVVGVLFSKILLVPWFTTTFSLHRYYDHIIRRGIEKGFLYSTDFDFLAFAFKALADEYRRNLRAPVVYELYGDLIDYLYAHNRGFDAARIAMDSNDHCEQEAAANIVGLWAQLEGAATSLPLQSRLLTKLADALDHQETGRAATSSFESIAKFDAEGQLLEVENGRGEKLVTILCNCISKAVKAKKEDKALVFIKVLIELMKIEAGRQQVSGTLVGDLQKVFERRGCRKRTVGVAGKALQLMGAGPSEEEVDRLLREPLPSEEEHILQDEEQIILDLLKQTSLPSPWASTVRPRGNTWPSGSANHATTIICGINLVIFVLIVSAVILCLYKIHNI